MSAPAQLSLAFAGWQVVSKQDPLAVALADRHYSRQTTGAACFTPPGRDVVLLTLDGLAAWAVVYNLDTAGASRFRCTLFRNEGPHLSSALIVAATSATYREWPRKYGSLPPEPLRTEVDASKVRRKRDPGRCFLRAGWRRVGETSKGLVVLEAPR